MKKKLHIDDYISFYIDEEKIHLFDYETSMRVS